MKFVPLRLFRFLHPVDIQKNIDTHFEQTLKELTAQNSEYHREIIQLRNQINQLSGELEETKQELELSNKGAKFWKANYDMKEEVLAAHIDAVCEFVNTLTKIGAKDPHTEGL